MSTRATAETRVSGLKGGFEENAVVWDSNSPTTPNKRREEVNHHKTISMLPEKGSEGADRKKDKDVTLSLPFLSQETSQEMPATSTPATICATEMSLHSGMKNGSVLMSWTSEAVRAAGGREPG